MRYIWVQERHSGIDNRMDNCTAAISKKYQKVSSSRFVVIFLSRLHVSKNSVSAKSHPMFGSLVAHILHSVVVLLSSDLSRFQKY